MVRKILNKKAQGHVEIILSFVIFIGALILIFIFINPFSNPGEEISIMDNVQRSIITEISSEIGKLSIILDKVQGGCYNFIDSDYGGNYIEVEDIIDLKQKKYNIYFSDDFTTFTNLKKDKCNSKKYTLGVYSKEEMISWNKVVILVNSYGSDYASLKSNLNIVDDFSFSFKYVGGNEIPKLSVSDISKKSPVGVYVESKEFPVRVIDDQAIIHELILNIRGW